jgi:hypothetical protein
MPQDSSVMFALITRIFYRPCRQHVYDMNTPKIAPRVSPQPMFLSAVPQAMPTVIPIPGHNIANMGNSDFFSGTLDFLICIICFPRCLQPNGGRYRHATSITHVLANALVRFYFAFK